MRAGICTGWIFAGILIFAGCVSLGRLGEISATWEEPRLDEASGLVVLPDSGIRVSHNDDTDNALYLADADGVSLKRLGLPGLKNRDWEDLALIPRDGMPPLVVIGEIGDNAGKYSRIFLHFVEVNFEDNTHRVMGTLPVVYPDGPRDAESLAWDSVKRRILILSKRDRPARLYAVPLPDEFPLSKTLQPTRANFLGLLGDIPEPTPDFISRHPRWGRWSAQPTAMDINAEGTRAVVLTYNDLYVYSREDGQDWAEALQGQPAILDIRLVGQTEAVAFLPGEQAVLIVPEGRNPPLLRVDIP